MLMKLKAVAEVNREALLKHRRLVAEYKDALAIVPYVVSPSGLNDIAGMSSYPFVGGDIRNRRDSLSTDNLSSSSSSRWVGPCVVYRIGALLSCPVRLLVCVCACFRHGTDSEDSGEEGATAIEGRKAEHWVFELDDSDRDDVMSILFSRQVPPVGRH